MKVILLKDVRGVGQHNSVREVSDGYATNFLIPRGLAVLADATKVAQLESEKKSHEAKEQQEEEVLTERIQTLGGKRIVLQARATEKGGLFKSLTAKDIAKAINAEFSVEIPEHAIEVPEHLKTVGEHEVALKSKSLQKPLAVSVVASAS